MKLLAVDDDKDTLAFLKDLLTGAGHEVMTASNAFQALILVKIERPDAILLDIMMPGIDGHQLAESLSSQWQTFDIPIIVLSCRKDEESKSWAKLFGCVRYLEKPAGTAEILDALRAVEERQGEEISPT